MVSVPLGRLHSVFSSVLLNVRARGGVDVQTGWSDVVTNAEEVLSDVEESVNSRPMKPGECPFQVPQLLHPAHHTYDALY